jgi:hypothetical protein
MLNIVGLERYIYEPGDRDRVGKKIKVAIYGALAIIEAYCYR